MRKFKFSGDKYYHIFNRGVEKRDIFIDNADFARFIRSMREFNVIQPIGSLYEKDFVFKQGIQQGVLHPIGCRTPEPEALVEFIVYSLLPNHYHFVLRQLVDGGIPEFMKRLGGGYTNYFNNKYSRSGGLFQGKFKTVEINSHSHFLKLAVYVNCNYEIHKLGKSEDWSWSSFLDYIGKRRGVLCGKEAIMSEFKDSSEFKNFCKQVLLDIIEVKELRKYFLE